MQQTKSNILPSDISTKGKSSPVAVLLASFFGFLGAHRFYTGYYFIGIFQALTCGGFLIWFIIDIVALFTNHFEDSKGNPLENYNSQIATSLVAFAVIVSIVLSSMYINLAKEIAQKFKNTEISTPLDNVIAANERNYEEKLESYGASKQESQTEEDYSNLDYEFTTQSGLNILKDGFCAYPGGAKMICGTIINTTNRSAKNITIKYHLFDKDGKFIAFSEAKIYKLDAQSEWEYKAPIYYKTCESYKIFKITSL